MLFESFGGFQKLLNSNKILMRNKDLNKLIQKFKSYVAFEEYETSEIQERKNESKIIIIDVINETNVPYFVVIFDYTILFLANISYLPYLINNFKDSTIYTIKSDIKSHLPEEFQNQIYEYEKSYYEVYLTTIESFSDKFRIKPTGSREVDEIWKSVLPSFSSYFINKSYQKLEKERLNLNYSEITEFNFIELQNLGAGSSATVQLVFDIEKEQLFAKKVYYHANDYNNSTAKSFQRETYSYRNIRHPSFPHFYGEMKRGGGGCLIIEYIRGRTLDQIKPDELSQEEQMNMILQLMIIIEYLQYHQFIYRDLKPNNIIYDENHQIILLDFNEMINLRELGTNYSITADFGSPYMCPEIKNGTKEYSFKEDVYSIGVLIYYIISHEIPKLGRKDKSNENNYSFDKLLEYGMKELCEECTETDFKNRPIITKLIDYFFNNFVYMKGKQTTRDIKNNINEFKLFPKWQHNEEYFKIFHEPEQKETYEYYIQETNKIHHFYQYDLGLKHYQKEYFSENISKFILYLSMLIENTKSQFYLAAIYYEDVYVTRDINKSIHYFTLAANQNNPYAQFGLGYIYYSGEFITRDINKSIHYFTLAANQNNPYAQCNLGVIYYSSEYITRDINKSIHYFTLAANQNNPYAQFRLGYIYYSGEYITRDINKSIHYFTLAANQNNPYAQFRLGYIYYLGEYVTRDINKSIHYLKLAANQNNPYAQCNLGYIYYSGEYITRDINKSIHYFTLAADQNNPYAQNNLGVIYSSGEFITRDINKSIHYFTLAANQNHPYAQCNLGVIYYSSEYITRDINKSIHYFTLAANQNHPYAQFGLGVIYYSGKYITRDINKSIHYLTLAADQNDPIAQNNLGVIYSSGEYITRDINKSIHYLTLAANQNNPIAQFRLGVIYYSGEYIIRDINKSIHYFALAANQNNPYAQFGLGVIYYSGKYITRDINKSIHYLTLAADQNDPYAQFFLGYIYYSGKYITRDINKSIHYLTLAANQNHPDTQCYLGYIYYSGEYITRDINKSIHYFTLAANQNHPIAQFAIGFLYLQGIFMSKNINKATFYLYLAAKQGKHYAQFILGVIYSKGEYFKQDIEKAIHYYKEASSFNISYAKNNLAVIYKNGIHVQKRIGYSIELLKESVKMKDRVSMYNLSHIYFYEPNVGIKGYDEIIDLLFKSINLEFLPSIILLSIVMIKKYQTITKETIQHEIETHEKIDRDKVIDSENIIYSYIKMRKLETSRYYESEYEQCRNLDFMYNYDFVYIETNLLMKPKKKEIIKGQTINEQFYEGFGIQLDQ